jgi:hypothetical protein
MQTVQIVSALDLTAFCRWLFRLMEHHPELPIALIKQQGQWVVGILNFEPDQEDWYQYPIPIEKVNFDLFEKVTTEVKD